MANNVEHDDEQSGKMVRLGREKTNEPFIRVPRGFFLVETDPYEPVEILIRAEICRGIRERPMDRKKTGEREMRG